MRTDTSELGTNAPAVAPRSNIALSKWVNEKLPAWNEVLGAREVARLTRRPRWILAALAFVGRFPKPQRFHRRAIGWHRRDVQRWLLDAAGLLASTDSVNCSGAACGRDRSLAERRRAMHRCTRQDRRGARLCRRPRLQRSHVRGITTLPCAPHSSQGESMELPFVNDGRIEP
jgi:predicted DNA-binding transcriptional regulator AlpA